MKVLGFELMDWQKFSNMWYRDFSVNNKPGSTAVIIARRDHVHYVSYFYGNFLEIAKYYPRTKILNEECAKQDVDRFLERMNKLMVIL
jgi:hypothetical protein